MPFLTNACLQIIYSSMETETLRVLELFSGIGGMHYALKISEVRGCIVAAVDINTVANEVYTHNHPETQLLNNNVQKFTPKMIEKMNVNTILMSPPCQPFTRVGNQRDVDDYRSDALKHFCDIVSELCSVDKILMENVKGFETSRAHDLYINCLKTSGFEIREFILSPHQLGVPNTRHRYFCIARRSKPFPFAQTNCILMTFPENVKGNSETHLRVEDIIEENTSEFLLPDKTLLKHAWVLDIVIPDDENTMCFTKAYTHYCEGTGSVFTPCNKLKVAELFSKVKNLDRSSSEYLDLLKSLKLRYFTPKEVSTLMSFPAEFSFPNHISNRQKYRLLGNSINVLVVSELIKLLYS